MRILLLLILGAGLIWFTWRSVGSRSEAQASAPGTMIEVAAPEPQALPDQEPRAPASASHPDAGAAHPQDRAVEEIAGGVAPGSGASQPLQVEPAPAHGATPAAESTPAPSNRPASTSAAELAAAQALLADPPGFAGWIGGPECRLEAERRAFAQSIADALSGREAQALAALDADGARPVSEERELIRRLAARHGPAALDVATSSPLARAASLVAIERAAAEAAEAGRWRDAVRGWSDLLLAEVAAPWRADGVRLERWTEKLRSAQANHRWSRRGDWPALEVVVQPGDSLIQVRKRVVAENPALLVCTGQIARANELSGEVIRPGQKLRIPTEKAEVLVDIDAHWVLFLYGTEVVAAWPAGVGREGSATQTGLYTVGEKTREPMWFPVGRKPVPFGDPENPLGTRWITWLDGEGQTTRLGFHGTNEPASIGRDASLGCIRMLNQDVEELFEILPRGARVRVQP